jgi:hypothetical protein
MLSRMRNDRLLAIGAVIVGSGPERTANAA